MRKIVLAVAFAVALAGCTTSPYGNFLKDTAAQVDQTKLAGEAVKQLVTLWPPAKTQFELQQATPDVFGAELTKGLRERGYALLEYHPEAAKAKAKIAATGTPASATTTLPLFYVLDKAGDANLYRLTLKVGNQTITRPYLEQDGALVPAGYWVRKEQ